MALTIGERISPILVEVEETLWEFEAKVGQQPHFTDAGFRAAIKIFMATLVDKMYDLQKNEGFEIQDAANMAQKAGESLRSLVKTYTDVDTYDFYKTDK
jgi:hypothetical protein